MLINKSYYTLYLSVKNFFFFILLIFLCKSFYILYKLATFNRILFVNLLIVFVYLLYNVILKVIIVFVLKCYLILIGTMFK
jgi:hypothetical protein